MFDPDKYMNDLLLHCRSVFKERLLYIGLQGSYLRGEAHENSDIDVMVILDRFSVQDMNAYREILQKIGSYDKSCGFICGREEMKCWNPLEICALQHTTKDLYGALKDHLPPAAREDEINFVKLSLGNLYHEICHRYIHADRDTNIAAFRGVCKSLFFLMQNLHYLESGRFVATKKELTDAISREDRQVLTVWDEPDAADFEKAFAMLFSWCQRAFTRVDKLKRRDYPVRRLTEAETQAALGLALRVFCAFESPDYGQKGTEEFQKCLNDEAYLAGICYYGAFDGEKLVGVLGIRKEKRHVCFFFVDGNYHRRGIGTKLFQRMREDFYGSTITLNSSPYGLPFYKALGFTETGSEQTVNGIRFTPMKYEGRAPSYDAQKGGERNR